MNVLCYTFNGATGALARGIILRGILYRSRENGLHTHESSGLLVGQLVERCWESGFSGAPTGCPDRYNSTVIANPPKETEPDTGVVIETGEDAKSRRLYRLKKPLDFETVASTFDHRDTEARRGWYGSEKGFVVEQGYALFLDANRELRAVPMADFLAWVNETYEQADKALLALGDRFANAAS